MRVSVTTAACLHCLLGSVNREQLHRQFIRSTHHPI